MSNEMNTGDISRRLGIPITVELLEELGFKAVRRDHRAHIWDQDDYPAMCIAIGNHITERQDVPMQPRPEPKPKKEKEPKPNGKKNEPAPSADDDW